MSYLCLIEKLTGIQEAEKNSVEETPEETVLRIRMKRKAKPGRHAERKRTGYVAAENIDSCVLPAFSRGDPSVVPADP